MEEGYIKISRKLLAWEWYTDEKTMLVFLHCLLKANWKDGRFRGVEVPRGSFVTSLPSLCEELKLTTQNVRTAINHLKSTGEITVKTYPHYRMITINKYNEYQCDNRQNNSQVTGNQQATNRQLTAIEEYKNKKNNKNIYSTPRKKENEELRNLEALYMDEVRRDTE